MEIPVINYADARSQIEDGDILIYKHGTGFCSFLVNLWLKSPYYHAAFAFWFRDPNYSYPRLMSIESTPGGERIVNLSNHVLVEKREFEVIKSPVKWFDFGPQLLDTSGAVPYAYGDFVTIGLKERFGIIIGKFKGEVCSEMVARCLIAQGIKIESRFISPGKLRDTLLGLGCTVKFLVTTPGSKDASKT